MKNGQIREAVNVALARHRKFEGGSAYHVGAEAALEDALSEALGEFRYVGSINGPATVKNMMAAARKAWPSEKKSGGAGRGQGRKAKDGATGVVRLTVQVTPEQREKVRINGGSEWVRRLIDTS